MDNLEAEINKELNNSIIKEKWDISEAFDALKWYVERKNKYWMLWNKSRFKEVDKLTEWFIQWSVYTIGAYSNVWKSRFSYGEVNQALKLWKKVMFFSLEEMKGIVLRNLICQRNWMRPSEIYNSEFVQEAFGEQFSNLYLYDSVFHIDEIEQKVHKYKPDYVFIDFIQNVQTSWWNWAYEKIASIAKQTQRIAIQNKCVLIQLSQVSNTVWKELAKGNTDFVSLKWAGELFASSDVIFILYKSQYEEFCLHIAKNKYWPAKDDFYFDVDRATSEFIIKENI